MASMEYTYLVRFESRWAVGFRREIFIKIVLKNNNNKSIHTSTVSHTQVRKSPDVCKPYTVPEKRQEVFYSSTPYRSLRGTRGIWISVKQWRLVIHDIHRNAGVLRHVRKVVCNTKAQYNQIIKKEIIFRSRFLFVYCCHGSLSNIVICWRLVGEVCFQYTNTIKSYNKKGNSPFTNSTPTFIFLIFVFVFCFLGVFQWFFFARFCFVVLLSCSCCPYRLFCFSAFGNAYHLVPFLACIILIGGL